MSVSQSVGLQYLLSPWQQLECWLVFLHLDHDVVYVDELVPDGHTLERRRLRQQLVEAVVVLDQLRQCALYTCRQAKYVNITCSYMSPLHIYTYMCNVSTQSCQCVYADVHAAQNTRMILML